MNRKPDDRPLPSGAPKDAIKNEFARRLQHKIAEKGWSQSETARQAAMHMPKGQDFGRDNISGYVRGLSLPGPVMLSALSKALGCDPIDLVPSAPSVDTRHPPLEVKDSGDGRAWIRINQAVDWPVALKIMELIKGQ